MQFEFRTASRIVFGPGSLQQVAPFAADTGKRALVVTGSNAERAEVLLQQLQDRGLACRCVAVAGEPTLETVQQALAAAREHQADLVIGFGGGSAVDAGKAVAALATNREDIRQYLEVIGRGRPLTAAPLPYVAVPTTAGTGAEATANAVLKAPREQVKVSLRSPLMLPDLAVVDPQLTHSLPPAVTASTGMDALTQLWEAFVSRRANPMTDALCREGLRRAARSLQRAVERPRDRRAREDMSLASLLSGVALANAGLGAVHGIAGPLGGMCAAAHGAACARLLPPVARANLEALGQRQPDSPSLPRFQEAACLLTGSDGATAADGIAWLQRLCDRLQIPTLTDCGFQKDQVSRLAKQAVQASSMKANPVTLTKRELEAIIKSAL